MLIAALVHVSRALSQTGSRNGKIALLAELLRETPPSELATTISFLSGKLRQGRVGLGWATIQAVIPATPAPDSTLTVAQVNQTFEHIAGIKGKGSAGEKARLLRGLFARATAEERQFLISLISAELRQGALGGVAVEAMARAWNVPVDLVRRAVMTTGDLALVAEDAGEGGAAALARYAVQLFRPVLPMLASTAADPAEALASLGEAALEYKVDGARVQVHRDGDDVKVYSRSLHDVTDAVPELVEQVRALPADQLILDGETVALKPDGAPHPFQVTMRRYGRKLNVERLRVEQPLTSFFFDILWLDGTPLVDEPYERRVDALRGILPPATMMPSTVTSSVEEANRFFQGALAAGHEGIMAKALDAPYEAGHRGSRWLKVKTAHTLDLVVLAAEWGHGRRDGWLSNLHLGARDTVNGGFVMLGKTFKGLTDAMLEWQTRRFLALEIGRDDYTVFLKPEVVVEVAFNEVQVSSRYPGKLALRFARVKRYREDKSAADADTFETVQAIARVGSGH